MGAHADAVSGRSRRVNVAQTLALAAIRAYQRLLSPALPPACRFEPTCSDYAYEAVAQLGVRTGLRLAARRLWRCHPGTRGGYDPVPLSPAQQSPAQQTVGQSASDMGAG